MQEIALIWIHFIADFLLQSNKMAINKSSSLKYLGLHCLIYSTPFIIFGFKFAMIVFLTHFLVDLLSSKATTKLYIAGERHWFFVVIGFDQAIHITTLLALIKIF